MLATTEQSNNHNDIIVNTFGMSQYQRSQNTMLHEDQELILTDKHPEIF